MPNRKRTPGRIYYVARVPVPSYAVPREKKTGFVRTARTRGRVRRIKRALRLNSYNNDVHGKTICDVIFITVAHESRRVRAPRNLL